MHVRNGLLSLAVLGLMAAGCPGPRGISNAHMSGNADGNDDVSTFSVSTSSVYCSIEYSNLAEGDSVIAKLVFGGQELVEKAITIGSSPSDGVVIAGFTNYTPPWPAGAYEVDIYLNGAKAKTVAFSFN